MRELISPILNQIDWNRVNTFLCALVFYLLFACCGFLFTLCRLLCFLIPFNLIFIILCLVHHISCCFLTYKKNSLKLLELLQHNKNWEKMQNLALAVYGIYINPCYCLPMSKMGNFVGQVNIIQSCLMKRKLHEVFNDEVDTCLNFSIRSTFISPFVTIYGEYLLGGVVNHYIPNVCQSVNG